MSELQTPFVDYYQSNTISPVAQDVTDLQKHFRRRAALYQQLGITPALLHGKRVVEFGPGSGHNSLFTAFCEPESYVLVDGNPYGLKETKQRLDGFVQSASCATVVTYQQALIDDCCIDEKFDFVFCEGMLSLQRNPVQMVKKVASFATKGGIVVVTCSDPVSSLSDIIRRLIGQTLTDPALPLQAQAASLAEYFQAHFVHLPNMSRYIEDWILDNVLQPFYGKFFSIPDALTALGPNCDFMGSSPRFVMDWRWYKDVVHERNGINSIVLENYYANIHNFIDHSCVFQSFSVEQNMKIYENSEKIFTLALEYQHTREINLFSELAFCVNDIANRILLLGEPAHVTCSKLRDAAIGLQALGSGKPFPNFGTFASLFGRGQQYVSFITL